MKDIKIFVLCPECSKPLTLMESCRGDDASGVAYLVIRCLKCGGYPVKEIARLAEDQEDLY